MKNLEMKVVEAVALRGGVIKIGEVMEKLTNEIKENKNDISIEEKIDDAIKNTEMWMIETDFPTDVIYSELGKNEYLELSERDIKERLYGEYNPNDNRDSLSTEKNKDISKRYFKEIKQLRNK